MNEECSKTASSDADNTINIGDETKKHLIVIAFVHLRKLLPTAVAKVLVLIITQNLLWKTKIWFRYTQTERQTQYVIAIYLRHINRNHTLKMHLSLTFTNLQLKQPENEQNHHFTMSNVNLELQVFLCYTFRISAVCCTQHFNFVHHI